MKQISIKTDNHSVKKIYNKYNSLRNFNNKLAILSGKLLKLGVDFINDSVESKKLDTSRSLSQRRLVPNDGIPCQSADCNWVPAFAGINSGWYPVKNNKSNKLLGHTKQFTYTKIPYEFKYSKFLERIITFRLLELELSSKMLKLETVR